MVNRSRAVTIGATAGATALLALAGGAPSATSASPSRSHGENTSLVLGVDGRASSAPSIAVHDRSVAIAWSARGKDGAAEIYAAASADGGRTFGAPVRVSDGTGTARVSGEQAPRVALLPGAGSATIDVLWTAIRDHTSILLARSTDGGRTFGFPRELQHGAAPGDRGWAALAIDPEGRAHAVWLDHRGLALEGTPGHGRHAARSTGRGGEGVAMAQKSALFYWAGGAERELARGVCYCCKTAIAAGPGGWLFIAWRHVYAGSLRDIAFMASSDGGRSFRPAVRVSDDRWRLDGCPDDGPALAVERAGRVHVVWPTVVQSAHPYKAVFHAVTGDGTTFSRREHVSLPGRHASHAHVAASADGELAVVWDEVVEGSRRVILRRRLAGASVFDRVVPVSDSAPASYPVVALTREALIVAWTEGAGETSAIRVRRIGR